MSIKQTKAILVVISVLLTNLLLAQQPVAQFTINGPTSGCPGMQVSFTDQSLNATSIVWDLGDGTTSSISNPQKVYTIAGVYTVMLVAKNANGSDTARKTITIYKSPTAFYGVPGGTVTSGCIPLSIGFKDSSTAGSAAITSWSWDFGDNAGVSNLRYPTYTYTQPGLYRIKIKVTDVNGCVDSITRTDFSVKATGDVKADFNAFVPIYCTSPVTVNFSNASTSSSVLTYSWNFDDAIVSTSQDPTHTYSFTGNNKDYNVTLTATDAEGCFNQKTKLVSFVKKTTGFTTDMPTLGYCLGDTAHFILTSTPDPSAYSWDFGDAASGGSNTSSDINPIHIFNAVGSFTVKLRNNFPGGCLDSTTALITVNALPGTPNFTGTNVARCSPNLITNFTASSTAATSFTWDFGDGSTSTVSTVGTTHTYTTSGNFNVILTAKTAAGCSRSVTKNAFVKISLPVITLANNAACVAVPKTFTATVSSVEPVTLYTWDFGNGVIQTTTTPSVSYAYPTASGATPYTLKLTVTTPTQCAISKTATVTVGAPFTAPVIDVNPTTAGYSLCLGDSRAFKATGVPSGSTYSWNFGDGGTGSTVAAPTRVFNVYPATPGPYNVILTITNKGCAMASNAIPIAVSGAQAGFSFASSACASGTSPRTFDFTDTSKILTSGNVTYTWDFDNGTPATVVGPVPASGAPYNQSGQVFTSTKSYNVKLTVATSDGCQNTFTKAIPVAIGSPVATTSTSEVCVGAKASFTSVARLAGFDKTYRWRISKDPTFITGLLTVGTTLSYSPVIPSAGTYYAKLFITDVYGCIDSSNLLTIQAYGVKAGFKGDILSGCIPINTQFSDTTKLATGSTGNVLNSWYWDFGDQWSISNTSNSQNPLHRYDSIGSYSIKLVVGDDKGCKDSVTKTAYVKTGFVKANFASPDSLTCLNNKIRVIDSTLGNVVNWKWTLVENGVGTSTVTGQNVTPFPAYTNINDTASLHQIKLVATGTNGCVDSIIKTIVLKMPKAYFNLSDTFSTCPPLKVQFTDSSYYVQSWKWTFGDGGFSTQQNPQYTYVLPSVALPGGRYYDTLIVTSAGGCRDTAIHSVRIEGPTGDVVLSSYHSPMLESCDSLTVRMTVNNANSAVAYAWDFGDGVLTPDIAHADTSHLYLGGGAYLPKAILIDKFGCRVTKPAAFTDSIKVASIKAFFDADKYKLCDNGTINFRDTGAIILTGTVAYAWNFGDGQTAVGPTPSHTYAAPGSYDVKLKVSSNYGCADSTTKVDFIRMVASPKPSIAVSDTLLCTPGKFTFTGTGRLGTDTSAIVSVNWVFDNGNTDNTLTPPQQTFTTAGKHITAFTSVNSTGCTTTVYDTVRILPIDSLKAKFVMDRPLACDTGTIQFTNQTTVFPSQGTLAYSWNFGDNNTGTGNVISHFYSDTASYQVKLKVKSSLGCEDSTTQQVRIAKSPKVIINVTDTLKCAPATFTYTDGSKADPFTTLTGWQWTFNNGTTSTQQNPAAITYNAIGNYVEKLKVTDANGCADSATRAVYVIAPPSPSIAVSDTLLCVGLPFTYTAAAKLPTDTATIASTSWSFDNGNAYTNTLTPPDQVYTTPGLHIATFTATNKTGCTTVVKDTVRVLPPDSLVAAFTSNKLLICGNGNIQFSNTTTTKPPQGTLAYSWDFGDNQTAGNIQNISHFFADTGYYTVKMKVTSTLGCSDSVKHTIRVALTPVAKIGVLPSDVLCMPGSFTYKDSTTYDPYTTAQGWNWTFANSTTSTLQNPVAVTYAAVGTYNEKLVVTDANGCTATDTRNVYVVARKYTPVILNDKDTIICMPGKINMTGTATPDISGIVSWKWELGNGATFDGQNPGNQTFALGTSTNKLTITDISGCVLAVTKTVTVKPLPAVVALKDTTICVGTSTPLTALGAAIYLWTPAASLNDNTKAKPIASPLIDTKYVVIGTDIYGCQNSDSLTVSVLQKYTMNVAKIADSLCIGQSRQLVASGAPAYTWSPSTALSSVSIGNPIANPTANTQYQVTGYDALHCFDTTVNINLSVFKYPTVNAGPDIQLLVGKTTTLTPTVSADVVSYAWTPVNENINCATCATPEVTGYATTNYILKVTNDGKCSAQDTVRVVVLCDKSVIFIPNTFSPNGDNQNDVFMIRGSRGLYSVKSMVIFNRYGQKVFERKDFAPNTPAYGWDGTVNGQKADVDAYVYMVEAICTNGEIFKFQGTVTLIR